MRASATTQRDKTGCFALFPDQWSQPATVSLLPSTYHYGCDGASPSNDRDQHDYTFALTELANLPHLFRYRRIIPGASERPP